MKEPCRVARAPHMPYSVVGEATLDRRLHWHINYHLRQSAGCSLLVLGLPPDGSSHMDTLCPDAPADCAWAGSSTLTQIVGRLRPLLRRTDVVEMEEGVGIGIVLPGTDAEGACSLYRRLAHYLAQDPPRPAGRETVERVQLSVDHASFDETSKADQLVTVLRTLTDGTSTSSLLLVVPLVRSGRSPSAEHRATARPSRGRSGHRGPPKLGRPRRPMLVEDPSVGGREEEALRLQADTLGVPYVRLPRRLTGVFREAISVQLSRELRAVPIGRTRGTLTVAMHDPTDAAAIQRLCTATGLRIFPVLVAAAELEQALEHLTSGKVAQVRPRTQPLDA